METKRLIPYSVHLPEEIYKKLKAAAGQRKASALVRDAITLIIEGDDAFNGGYNKGIRDAMSLVKNDSIANRLGIDDTTVSAHLCNQLETMIVHQNVKGKKNGKAKT